MIYELEPDKYWIIDAQPKRDQGCVSAFGVVTWGYSRYFRVILLNPGSRLVIESRTVTPSNTSRYVQCIVSNNPSLSH